MGGGKGNAPPAPPDYTGAGIAQGLFGLQNTLYQSQLNNPNAYGPYGSVTYGVPGGWTGGSAAPPVGGSYSPGVPPGGEVARATTGGAPGSSPVTTIGSGITLGGGGSPGVQPGPGLGTVGEWGANNPGVGGYLASAADPIGSFFGSKGKGRGTPGSPTYNLGQVFSTLSSNVRPSQITTLSPAEQALFNAQKGQQLGLAGTGLNVAGSALGNTTGKLDLASLPSVTQGADQINKNVVDALYKQQTQYLDPQFAREREQLNQTSVAEGLGTLNTPTTEAGKNALDTFNENQRQAYSNALYNAQIGGTQAGYTASQENLAGAQMGLQEQQLQQMLPLDEIRQIMGLAAPTIPQAAGASPASFAAPPNLLGAAQSGYEAQLGNYNAGQAQQASTEQGLAGLASLAALAFLGSTYAPLSIESMKRLADEHPINESALRAAIAHGGSYKKV